MRVLQIGAGRWGRNHVRSWQRLGANLCLFDLDPAACAPFDVPTAASIDAALGSVDAVDVVTPSSTHAALVRQAIEAGKDVFVEKPLTPRADEAFELDALARERNAILQVGHVFRFSPEAGGLKRLLEAGHIGLPTYASGQFGGFKRPRADGGAAISDGIHWIDLASWLLGAQPRAVQATLRDTLGRGLDDVALLTLDYGDTLVQIEAGYHLPEPRRNFTVMGPRGALTCDFLAEGDKLHVYRGGHVRDDTGAWQAPDRNRESHPTGNDEPLLDQLDAFVDACRTRTPSEIAASGFDGAAAVAAVEACNRAATDGRRVEVKLPTPARGEDS
ncbi:MAG: Gfo/Idh/MocA family oxidoreductase [Myxococcota bacterium]|jgi:predicted dehydrogenase|nr:hypothetical protein [Deltaproteobacteria bacterium]MCP4241183.1 Gfo/Idh/MocA family oxidoreductase [bacterium]MDP6075105.1 Gfo/Idh/MocA family oxidoreductase [Myxococcota bacterium]MDP7074785.1 Gfo/Idh/MocA family oxidoreductase [Myxococcota bacterium]MDP7298894.1 Gfo/Idh/MocA family oxidoreductase [Myxococcota bacterium]